MTEKEFKTYVMRYHQEMTAAAVRLLRDTDDVRDCIQESYARLWRGRSRLKEIENVRAYCLTTVRNCALVIIKEKRWYSDIEEACQEDPDRPDLIKERKEEVEEISEMINRLPPRERQVLSMSTLSGLQQEEVCRATGLTDQNVRTILSRARKRLRELWTGREKEICTLSGQIYNDKNSKTRNLESKSGERTERRIYG